MVAISILGLGAAVQLAAICWAFIGRFHAPPMVIAAQVTESEDETPTGRVAPMPDFSADPLTDAHATAEGAPPSPTTAPRPTPIPIQLPKPMDAVTADRFNELIEQGRAYRERGDTGTALTRFREAQALDSRNPRALTEMATTFEKMSLPDRANEQWKRVYELGEAAGVHYVAAEAKLKAAQANEVSRLLMSQTAAPAEETTGLAKGAVLGLADIKIDEQTAVGASKKFAMHLPIKARFGAKIDANELVIQVHFFDVVDSARVERTSANVHSVWGAPPPDWAEGDTEELEVVYELPAEKRNRKYFGYLVRLYYKGELQTSAGTPESLLKKYPPPQTLQNEPNP
jgi:hypothetical protein